MKMLNLLNHFRIEKEKQQFRGEIEDLQAQLEHVSKNRVIFIHV